jgi:hypothetical protein
MCLVASFLDGRLRHGRLTMCVCMCSFHPQVATAEESWSHRCQTLPCLVRAHAKQQIELIIIRQQARPLRRRADQPLALTSRATFGLYHAPAALFWQPQLLPCMCAHSLCRIVGVAAQSHARLLCMSACPHARTHARTHTRTHTHTHTHTHNTTQHTHTHCCLLVSLCCPVRARRQTLSV